MGVSLILQLDDLPDFLSGAEQENTVHVRVHYTRATPIKGRKFFGNRKSVKKSPRPLPGDPILPRTSLEKEVKNGRRSPGTHYLEPPGITLRPSSPQAGTSPPVSPLATTAGESLPVSPVGTLRSPPIGPLAQTEGRRSPVSPRSPRPGRGGRKSPPGNAFSTRSNLEITHHHPVGVGGGRKGWKDDVESPFLQEIPLPVSPVAGPREHRVAYSQSTKLGSSSSKLISPHSMGREGTQLKSASSLKHLTSPSPISLSQLQEKTLSQPNLYASTSSAAQTRHQLSAAPPHRASSSGVLSSCSLPPSPHPSSPPCTFKSAGKLASSGNLAHLGGLWNMGSGNLGLEPNLGGSGNLGLEKLAHLGGSWNQLDQAEVEEEQGRASAEVVVLDIYVLKQATNLYHLLKGMWVDARTVSLFSASLVRYSIVLQNQVLQSELMSPVSQTKGSPKP